MKKVLFYTIPATLLLTLGIGYYAYAWSLSVSATCYNHPSSGTTVASAAASASGLEDNLARARAFVGGSGYEDEGGPSEGSVSAYALQIGNLGDPAKAYAYAEGRLPDGTLQSKEKKASCNLN